MGQHWTINGRLSVTPAPQRPELVAPPVARALRTLPDAGNIGVAAIDPMLADTAQFCEFYDVPLSVSANCVVVAGKRGGDTRYAACLALATTRVNVNTVVRKHLGARKASFAPMDAAVELTGMAYGGITPVGLPQDWAILVDLRVAAEPELVIGGGTRGSKLLVSGETLAKLPGAQIVEGLASSI